jgi:hypothetical protein
MSAGIVDSTTSIARASTVTDSGGEVMRRVFLRCDAVASGSPSYEALVAGGGPWVFAF